MCNCSNTTCPQCDPGIEAFYQLKVAEAKEEAARMVALGWKLDYRNLMDDAKDIWYEYCSLRDAEAADEYADKIRTKEREEMFESQERFLATKGRS